MNITASVSSHNDGDKCLSGVFVSSAVELNFSASCHADDETHTHLLLLSVFYSVSSSRLPLHPPEKFVYLGSHLPPQEPE